MKREAYFIGVKPILPGLILSNLNLFFGGLENFAGKTGVLAAILSAAAVRVFSSFRKMKGITEAPTVTAGPPAAVV